MMPLEQSRRDLDELKAQSIRVEASAVGLREEVASGLERRCPFIKVDMDPQKEDSPEVDMVCDVRIQTFSDNKPFGPMNLQICELCIRSKALDAQGALADAQLELMSAGAPEEPEEPDADAHRSYG